MMDKEKIEQAMVLLEAAGVKTYILLTMDDEHHNILLNGTRRDLASLLANALEDEDLDSLFSLAVIARIAKGRRNMK